MINELQTTALGCIAAGARYGRFRREAVVHQDNDANKCQQATSRHPCLVDGRVEVGVGATTPALAIFPATSV
jgi:hypothetical protein